MKASRREQSEFAIDLKITPEYQESDSKEKRERSLREQYVGKPWGGRAPTCTRKQQEDIFD